MKNFILIAGALLLLGCEQEEQRIDNWTITREDVTYLVCTHWDAGTIKHYFQIDSKNNIFHVWQDVADSWHDVSMAKKPKWSQGIGFTTHKVTENDLLKYTANPPDFYVGVSHGMEVGSTYIKGFLPENHSLKNYRSKPRKLIPPEKWRTNGTTGQFLINKASLRMWFCEGNSLYQDYYDGRFSFMDCYNRKYECKKYTAENFQETIMNPLRDDYFSAIEEQKRQNKLKKERERDKF